MPVSLSKQIPYARNFRKQLLINAILGFIVAFIMLFLQPFDTYQFNSEHKYLILIGFGVLFSVLYVISGWAENLWYNYKNGRWNIKYEIISFLALLFISSIVIHFYNQVFLNDFFNHSYKEYEYIEHGFWFFLHAIAPIIFILLPFYVYLRNTFGEVITAEISSNIAFCGLNKGEKILIPKESVLFVKSSENYVEIFYEKDSFLQQVTYRNTLIAIAKQAPFLHRCHRSYLVNIRAIKTAKGNSQNAKIEFHHTDLAIPISKSYYKIITSVLNS